MNKSDFYKKYYTRSENQELNEHGYPNLLFRGAGITDANTWNEFLETQIDLPEFFKLSEDACAIANVAYVVPYERARIYPEITEQLDGIYKCLLSLSQAGLDVGLEGNTYISSITTVKEQFPKN